MSFSLDIERFAKKRKITLEEAARSIKLDLFSSVIISTRVDTGRLRGNWQTTTGMPKLTTIDRLDPAGTEAIKEVINTVQGDTVDYMTNNLPYAEAWEEQDAMVEKNMARINRIVKESVRSVV